MLDCIVLDCNATCSLAALGLASLSEHVCTKLIPLYCKGPLADSFDRCEEGARQPPFQGAEGWPSDSLPWTIFSLHRHEVLPLAAEHPRQDGPGGNQVWGAAKGAVEEAARQDRGRQEG